MQGLHYAHILPYLFWPQDLQAEETHRFWQDVHKKNCPTMGDIMHHFFFRRENQAGNPNQTFGKTTQTRERGYDF